MSTAEGIRARSFVRTAVLSSLITVAALAAIVFEPMLNAAVTALSPCGNYAVTSSAPPPSANWTDTSGALWTPAGGFPGLCSGDSATDAAASPTTIIVNSQIPQPLSGLDWSSCNGCVIDIQSGGQLTLAGNGTIGSGATLNVEPGGIFTMQAGAALTVQSGGTLGVNGGYLDVQSGAQLTISGSATVGTSGTLNVNGTMTVNSSVAVSSAFIAVGSATIDGAGTMTIGSGATLSQNGGDSSITAVTNIGSGGTTNVMSGALHLGGGGTADGPFAITAGATLDFPSGSYTMNTAGTVSGDGTLSVSGATLSIGGVTSPGGLTFTAGTITGAGFLSVGSSMVWSGGTFTGSGGTELAGRAGGIADGATGTMLIDGRVFNVYGQLVYAPTSNSLQLANGAQLNVHGTFDIQADGAIDGSGGGTIGVFPNGYFVKSGGSGTMTIAPDFTNNYSVVVTSGTLAFNGSGSSSGSFISDVGAVLRFGGNVTLDGSSAVYGSGGVEFANASASVQGFYDVAGTTTISGGGVSAFSSMRTNGFAMTGGTLSLYDDFEMTGSGHWSGGTIRFDDGSFIVDSGASLLIDPTSTATLQGAVLVNNGTVTYTPPSGQQVSAAPAGRTRAAAAIGTGSLVLQNGSTIENDGTFNLTTDAPIVSSTFIGFSAPAPVSASSARRFNAHRVTAEARTKRVRPSGLPMFLANLITNNGTFEKTGGSGSSDIGPDFDNYGILLAQSGTMTFPGYLTQFSGSTTLGPGSIAAPNYSFDIIGGVLQGAGSVVGDVQNAAQVAPGGASATGAITITGNYTQSSGGDLAIEIGGAASYDKLTVTGTATLDGTLDVTLINGFTPNNGDVFPILGFAARSGDFAVKNLPTFNGTHGSFTANYTPTELDLIAVVTPSQSDLAASMTGPATVNAGAPLSYTITITNNGADATGGTTTVTDTLPAGVTGASGSGTGWSCGAPSNGVITCTSTASIASTSTFPQLTISMTAPASGGSITNSATVSNAADPTSGNNSASANTTVAAQADLSITKSGPGGVTSGQNITYTILVTNNGPSTANNVVVSDPTPSNLTFVQNSGGCNTSYPCTIGTLAPNASVTITSTYSTSPSFSGNVSNTASVSASTADPDTSNNQVTATTNVGAQADLVVTKNGPATVPAGQNVTYTITVTNNGPSPAASTVVSDPTPVGIAFLSNAGGCTTTYPCSLGTLAAGQTVTITSTYNVPPTYSGSSISNTASASSAISDPNGANSSATATTAVTPSSPAAQTDLAINGSGPSSVARGQNVTYSLTVTNAGPSPAPNVFVNDPAPAGATFVSATGCSSFPCSLGTLAAGQSVPLTVTFAVPANYAGSAVTNTASVSTSASEANSANNSVTVVTPISAAGVADLAISKSGPSQVTLGEVVQFGVFLANAGPSPATNVVVADPTPQGLTFVDNSGACTTPFPCVINSIPPGGFATITSRYRVTATSGTITNTASVSSSDSDPSTGNNTSSVTMAVIPPQACPQAPALVSPRGTAGGEQVTFTWTAVPNATSYTLRISAGGDVTSVTTSQTSSVQNLPNGSYSWSVTAQGSAFCAPATSESVSFSVCAPPGAPLAGVVAEVTTEQTYTVSWTAVEGATAYEVQEATDAAFSNPVSTRVAGTSRQITKNVSAPTPFYYRVRVVESCSSAPGSFSGPATIAVVPLPPPGVSPNIAVPAGSTTPVTFPLFVPGRPGVTTSFVATVDKPWLSVVPTSGVVGPEGTTVTISADPSALTNGTWTGTVIIIYGTSGVAAKPRPEDNAPKTSIPVSISLTTPVTPGAAGGATASAVVIPSVGHLAGLGSQWQSDVRIANVTAQSKNILVTFVQGGVPGAKQTTLSVGAGATVALDDAIRKWFGAGSLGESASGILTVQPLDPQGRPDTAASSQALAASRTYNLSGSGTFGQFIPAVPISSFISKAPGASSILSLQQIAQNDSYRTNLGLVEASGKPASVLVSVFNGGGTKLLEVPFTLAGSEQRQLNSFLADKGIALDNGHVEVQATGGEGKVTTYASVIDSRSNDPLLVSAVALGAAGTSRYVVPGVASLDAPAKWRSDVRIFNSSNAPQTATLTLYPLGDPAASVSRQVTIDSGEVKALDDVVHATFGLTNVAGALHVTTASASQLVVTARTYEEKGNATVGQFVPAVTLADAIGNGGRALQLLQLEDSSRYRTNIGVAEISGKPATVELTVILPDSKVAPRVQIPLAAFEFRQFAIVNNFGLGDAYNVRISARVIDGDGRVTAYGSVIDRSTEDPTFVPAQ